MTEETRPGPVTVVPPLRAAGPLGLCYQCIMARKADPARQVAEAVTLAPAKIDISDALGNVIGVAFVALPHCQRCLAGPGTGSRLITS
jgi:hypothetical protein